MIFDATIIIVWGQLQAIKILLRHKNIQIQPINNPTMAVKCSRERKSHTPFTLNQKLEMIQFSEEGIMKAKIGWKVSLLHQTVICKVVTAKDKSWKHSKCYSSEHTSDKNARRFLANVKNVLVAWNEKLNQSQQSLKPETNLEQGPNCLQYFEDWERWRSCRKKRLKPAEVGSRGVRSHLHNIKVKQVLM